MRDESATALRALVEVVERLRAPGGCPWDREQTHRTLRPYLLEEAYEVLDAIEDGTPVTLQEELGDLLLQVLMHAVIAQEEEAFDIGDVAETARQKMVHRHPHVFGDAKVSGAAEVVVNWEKLKRVEKAERTSLLDGVPRTLPALAHAHGVQKRPARIGFDETPSVQTALEHVANALRELQRDAARDPAAAAPGEDWARPQPSHPAGSDERQSFAAPSAVEDAVGELLFQCVALARHLRVNPEEALRRRTHVFAQRFRALEQRARDEQLDLHEIDSGEWRRLWRSAADSEHTS